MKGHPRSLILMQLVSKGLNWELRQDHALWVGLFKGHFKHTAFMDKRVHDPIYSCLKLYKQGLNGVPYHVGPLPGEKDADGPAFMETFCSYVRRWYALLHGTRCGMCGSRFRHEVFWSLRMRVCTLCVAGNTVGENEIFDKYGLNFTDHPVLTKGFFFTVHLSTLEDRLSSSGYGAQDIRSKHSSCVFWRPHIEKTFDLPKFKEARDAQRLAARVLCAHVRTLYVTSVRTLYGSKHRRSIDGLVITLNRNEKCRLVHPYGNNLMSAHPGSDWGIPDAPFCRKTRHYLLTGQTQQTFYHTLGEHEDAVVERARMRMLWLDAFSAFNNK